MNRNESRIHKKNSRRVGVVLASLTLAVGTAGFGGVAFANEGKAPGGQNHAGEYAAELQGGVADLMPCHVAGGAPGLDCISG